MSSITARTGIRIAVVTGAAVICAGTAVPAMAHDSQTYGMTPNPAQQLTFAQQKDRALAMLAQEANWLTGLKAKVAADDRLTAAQKDAFGARLDRALAQVAAARAAAEAATTPSDLYAAMDRAELPYLAYPRYELPSLADVKAAADRVLDARQASLDGLKTRVSGDNRLTPSQRADYLAKIDKALARIAAAKDAVAAATTRAAVRAAVAGADARPGRYPRHRHLAAHGSPARLASAVTTPHRSVTVRWGADRTGSRGHCDGYRDHDGDRDRWGTRDGDSRYSGDRDGGSADGQWSGWRG